MTARGFVAGAVAMALGTLGPSAAAQPPPAEAGPPSAAQQTAPTIATFTSSGFEQWDVAVDGQPVCATPCSLPLHPMQSVTLLSQEPNPIVLGVGHLPPGQLFVTGKPMQEGMYAGGIVATTLGGMALATGITLLSVGLAQDRDGMTVAGAISGAAGALTVPLGIYLMVRAVPSVSIGRAAPPYPAAAAGIGGRF